MSDRFDIPPFAVHPEKNVPAVRKLFLRTRELDVYKRQAVYTLLDIPKKICPVTPYKKDPKILLKAIQTAYR